MSEPEQPETSVEVAKEPAPVPEPEAAPAEAKPVEEAPAAEPKKKRGRPPGSKNKPKAEAKAKNCLSISCSFLGSTFIMVLCFYSELHRVSCEQLLEAIGSGHLPHGPQHGWGGRRLFGLWLLRFYRGGNRS